MTSRTSAHPASSYSDTTKLVDVLVGLAGETGKTSSIRNVLQMADLRFDQATELAVFLDYVDRSSGLGDLELRLTRAGKKFASNRHRPVLTREPDFELFAFGNVGADSQIRQWNLIHGFVVKNPNPVDEVEVVSTVDGIEASVMSRACDSDAVRRALSPVREQIKKDQDVDELVAAFAQETGPWRTLPVNIEPAVTVIRSMRLDNAVLDDSREPAPQFAILQTRRTVAGIVWPRSYEYPQPVQLRGLRVADL